MKNKLHLYLVGILLLFVIIAVPRMDVSAAANKAVKLAPDTLWYGDEVYAAARFLRGTEKAKLISVKSSRPKVIRAMKDEDSNELWATTLMPLKLGKSKITVTYKYNGKKYTTSAMYTVKKYPSPFKAIKVNGKKISLKQHKYSYNVEKYKKSKVTIRFSLKSGWKLMEGYTYDQNGNYTPVKNGATIKVPKGKNWTCIFLNVVNKNNETMQYSLRFKRG